MKMQGKWLAALGAAWMALAGAVGANAQTARRAAYQVAADDVLSVTVVNFPNLSAQATVMPDGTISLPLLKPVRAAGKTTAQLERTLTQKWSDFVIGPSVTVSLAQKHRETVLLSGLVTRPGPTEYHEGMRALEALAGAGGPTATGDLRRVVVTRRAGGHRTLDLSRPETSDDIALDAGDMLSVSERRAQFSVLGEVVKPGSFDYKDDMTVLDALTFVGGVKETADLKAASLTHEGREQKMDLDALLRSGDMSRNVKLAPGDRLIVPELNNRTYVYGAVSRPGYYAFRPGDRLLDALNGTGGPVKEADLAKVNVIHINKTKDAAEVHQVNLEAFLKRGTLAENAPLAPGDVIYIPDKKHGFRLDNLWGALTGLNLLQTGARIITRGLAN